MSNKSKDYVNKLPIENKIDDRTKQRGRFQTVRLILTNVLY